MATTEADPNRLVRWLSGAGAVATIVAAGALMLVAGPWIHARTMVAHDCVVRQTRADRHENAMTGSQTTMYVADVSCSDGRADAVATKDARSWAPGRLARLAYDPRETLPSVQAADLSAPIRTAVAQSSALTAEGLSVAALAVYLLDRGAARIRKLR